MCIYGSLDTAIPGSSREILEAAEKISKTVPDVLVQDGEKAGCLLVITAPGHTPGSISLLDNTE